MVVGVKSSEVVMVKVSFIEGMEVDVRGGSDVKVVFLEDILEVSIVDDENVVEIEEIVVLFEVVGATGVELITLGVVAEVVELYMELVGIIEVVLF